jgi:hypothetical protein
VRPLACRTLHMPSTIGTFNARAYSLVVGCLWSHCSVGYNSSVRLKTREAGMAGGNGMMQEFAKAKARASKLPQGSRPVVTQSSTITRATAIRSTQQASGTTSS